MVFEPIVINNAKLYNGNCLDVMKGLPDNSIDSIITDPPYGLGFMGKDWDYGVPGIIFWKEMLRIAKPGAILMAFGGTRTFHRLTCAIEDSGWEIKDCMNWMYGTGFPKSMDISKALDKQAGVKREVIGSKIGLPGYSLKHSGNKGVEGNSLCGSLDGTLNNSEKKAEITAPATKEAKQWNGWGTALKPAWEPIIIAMKPIEGTYADNALKWGVAGFNIDGGRLENIPRLVGTVGKNTGSGNNGIYGKDSREDRHKKYDEKQKENPKGRFPSNLILDEESAKMLDEKTKHLHAAGNKKPSYDDPTRKYKENNIYQSGFKKRPHNPDYYQDSGGASRFFYCAKACKSERGEYNNHPTVKPLELMKYLCRLTKTPTGGIVLDPFMGSGTTGLAAKIEGREFIGIELEKDYIDIVIKRLQNGDSNE